MLDTPTGIFAVSVLVFAVALSISIVLYAISLTLRASHPAETPREMVDTLKEAITTLGRTSNTIANALRSMAPQGPDLLGADKVTSAPEQEILHKILIILNTPTKERTDESFAFLEHYATGGVLRKLIASGDTNPDIIQNFALDRRTHPETRTHLLKQLHRALTEDTDSFPIIPSDPGALANPKRAKGRSAVTPTADSAPVVATGQVTVDVQTIPAPTAPASQ